MMARQSKIPHFETLEEEAAFWDTHDTTAFEDEFEPVEVQFAVPLLKRGLTIPLDEAPLEKLRRLARQKGVEMPDLARMWVLERLQTESG